METKVCVVGLGYVGLPLACLLSKHFPVTGFDINAKRIDELQRGIDRTGEVENLTDYRLEYSAAPAAITAANFIIVAVPTPITDDFQPDLRLIQSASELVGTQLQPGSVVVYESTVYPGCTEEVCVPLLEKHSGLRAGKDFGYGYSPERVNPGDRTHTIDKVVKIVSANSAEALERVKTVYGAITAVHPVSSVKVAEAAKVIENVQRDLNIALMNELALIFNKVGIDTQEVIDAAATKWNFHRYTPGMVGGHCIGVDPYYLTYKAKQLGYEPKVILAGREVNESMAGYVVSKLHDCKNVLLLGVTFKENVSDTRNSKASDIAQLLEKQGSAVQYWDPYVTQDSWNGAKKFLPDQPIAVDAIVVFSPHQALLSFRPQQFRQWLRADGPGILFDVKGAFRTHKADYERQNIRYLTL